MAARSMVDSDQAPRFSFIRTTRWVSVSSTTLSMVMPPVICRSRMSPETRFSVPPFPYFCQKVEMRAASPELKASSHCRKT